MYVDMHVCMYARAARGSLSVQTMAYRRSSHLSSLHTSRCRRGHTDGNACAAEIAPRAVPRSRPRVGSLIVKMLVGAQRDPISERIRSQRDPISVRGDVWPTDGVHMRCTYAEVRRVPVHICICAYGSRLGRVPGCVVCGVSRANVLVCISERSIGGSCRRQYHIRHTTITYIIVFCR